MAGEEAEAAGEFPVEMESNGRRPMVTRRPPVLNRNRPTGVVEGKVVSVGSETPKRDSNKEQENHSAFDGSPMPTQDLPEIKYSNIEQMFVQAIKPLSKAKPPVQGLIYGGVGTMKTTNAMFIMNGLVPADKKILYVDSAEGWTTLMNYPELRKAIDDERILHMQYENIEQLQELAKLIRGNTKPPFSEIGGIVFDEYTSMHDEDLNWIVDTRAAQAKKDGGFKDSFTPALPDYNAARIRSNRTIALFMKNRIHLIFIGHSKETKKLEQLPDMPEKAGKALYSKLHFAYFTYVDKDGSVKMQTVNGNRRMAKNRINGIGAHTTPSEFIEAYRNWGGKELSTVVPEAIPDEIPDEDLKKMLED